jgi:squalene-hopene/tetraprenyl-beta-curcumene cyclase
VAKKMIILFLLLVMITFPISFAEEKEKPISDDAAKMLKKSLDQGVRFLRKSQSPDGHWHDPGITALALTAFFKSPRKYTPKDGPWIRKPLQYLLSFQKEDGGIYDRQLSVYVTSVAIMALTANPQVYEDHKEAVDKAVNFIKKIQCDEGEGYTPKDDIFYGGIGYGSDERPDLSNTQFALEALHSAGVPKDDPVFQKAVIFLQRCQNRSESNDEKWSSNDGGFVYYPGYSMAGSYVQADGTKGHRSYGSMTYAGIKSYIHADLKPEDPRVKAAIDWIRDNYDLSENPGMGEQGLFYYYQTFAKTFAVLGTNSFVDSNEVDRNWREDMIRTLSSRQNKDGSWKNANPRWWESNPQLVTAYSVLALSYVAESMKK